MAPPPYLEEYYANLPLHHLTCLRLIRINAGIDEAHQDPFNRFVTTTRRSCLGVDIIITLLRQLIGLGYGDDGHERTNAESAFLDVAQRDIGRNVAIDWELKWGILNNFTFTDMNKERDSFEYFLNHPHLRGLFSDNLQFRLVSSTFLKRTTRGLRVDILERTSEIIRNKNKLIYDGTVSLSKSVEQVFASSSTEPQYVAARAKFLQIRYESTSANRRDISELRLITVELPAIGVNPAHPTGSVLHGRWSARYQLCAVIALQDDHHTDDIRTYWKNGTESVPVGLPPREDEPPIDIYDPWSIKDDGTYMLYYFHLLDEPDEPLEMDISAPEFKAPS